ncbi:carboxymuconolactone decarboxylase family protein [Botryobacter ruber]|uniref:carboxymuconolactone decarboxylase family protein n=1 Tax=Botryobacter ruber TaxID=2171629 RepID=UPI000E0BF70C|nr:hypothetical protein [Botryobacter ruber]
MAKTLAEALKPVAVDWETLHKQYNPLLVLVRELIGIIPNCDPVLEIWPPGFRTYNLLVPNMFNLPNTLFGSKSFKASMGLAMYASSKAACAYCTAHACSFALRRGASTGAITGSRTPKEQAVVTLAEGLAGIPARLTLADVEAVKQHFSPSETEWLVFSISMMGFLNKFMNGMGVELEQEAINDTAELLAQTGWAPGIHAGSGYLVTKAAKAPKDNLFTFLRVIRQAPGAVLLEKKWTKGVPANYKQAAEFLNLHTGYSFPILKPITQGRVIRALTTSLRDNLNIAHTLVGLKTKMLAAYILSTLLWNDTLTAEVKSMIAHITPELQDVMFNRLAEFSQMAIPADHTACKEVMTSLQQQFPFTEMEAAALLLTVAAAHSPAQINEAIIETVLAHLKPAGVVEIIVWLSVLQLLNRLSIYYAVVKNIK